MRYRSPHAPPLRHRLAILVVAATFALLAACGNGDKPAIEPGTTYPSTAASPGTSPGAASPSPSPATLTPGSSPTAPDGDQVTDASIKAAILRRIAESPALTGLRIRVAVKDKTVRLGGKVKTNEQKSAVEQIAVTEPGVVKVVSYLIVEPDGDGGY